MRIVLRWLAALLFIAAGFNHFRDPRMYASIVPPGFAHPPLLVVISGLGEIVGGFGLLISRLRLAAGFGLILLLIAVFPANIWMATHPERFVALHLPAWAFWARLPLQLLLIAWVWFVAKPQRG